MRKRKGVAQVLLGILLAAALVLVPMACKPAPPEEVAPPPVAPPEEVVPPPPPPEEVVPPPEEVAPPVEVGPFSLADIPEIANKRPLVIAIEAGGEETTLYPFIEQFTEKTGIPIKYDAMMFEIMYGKENIELVAGTGAYDVVIVEACWTNEWASYLFSNEELAAQYEPEGVAAVRREMAKLEKCCLRCASDTEGVVYGWPYECYTCMMMYRWDVFKDATEKANFLERYGYDLAPATTWDELRDQGEFFTRKEGELLRGTPLTHDLYGMALMAGRFPHVQDDVGGILWGIGGNWATVVRDEEGRAIAFTVTEDNKTKLEEAFTIYVDLLQFAHPGSLGGFWDFCMGQFAAGNVIITPTLYDSCYPWMSTWGPEVAPDARIGPAPEPFGQPYCGNFQFAVARASQNPEGAYWLSKYMGCYDVHKAWIESGFIPARRDVVEEYQPRAIEEHELIGWIPTMLWTWDNQYPYINDYPNFNSAAWGKIYDYQTELCHDVAAGTYTPAEGVEEWVRTFTELQTKFGRLPVH